MFNVLQDDLGNVKIVAQGGGSETDGEVIVEWDANVDAALVRGTVDTDRTALALRRSDGTRVYIYVDTGTTVLCSTTHP
jgi:hypothetical protein